MALFRGFIAIDVKASSEISNIINEFKKSVTNIKLVEPKNIHITLKFLGDTDENLISKIKGIIEESVEDINPFEIKIKDTGVFPNENYIKVIWIGIKNHEQIAEIAKKIDDQLSKIGFKKEKRKFSPHITIGRVKSGKDKEKILQILNKYKNVDFIDLKIDSIKLKKSELNPKGPIYTTLKEIKIGQG